MCRLRDSVRKSYDRKSPSLGSIKALEAYEHLPIKQKNWDLRACQWVNTDCSTHPKGTNRKRARYACFRLFAVVIRHLISRPQRCQNLRQTSQQKFEGMRKSCNGYEGSPFDDQIAVPRRNAVDGEGYFLHVHIRLDGRLTNDHLSESFPSLQVS